MSKYKKKELVALKPLRRGDSIFNVGMSIDISIDKEALEKLIERKFAKWQERNTPNQSQSE